MDVAAEVQLVGEQLDHLGGQLGRGAGGQGRAVERILHLALGDGGLLADLLLGLAHAQCAVEGARQGDGGDRTGAQLQADQPHWPPVVERTGHGGLEGEAGLDVHGVEGGAHQMHGLLGLGRRQPQAQQRLLERLAGQHLHRHLLEPLDVGLRLGLAGFEARDDGVVRLPLARHHRLAHGQPPAQRQGGEARGADQEARRVPHRRISRVEFLHRTPERDRIWSAGFPALTQLRASIVPLSQIRA